MASNLLAVATPNMDMWTCLGTCFGTVCVAPQEVPISLQRCGFGGTKQSVSLKKPHGRSANERQLQGLFDRLFLLFFFALERQHKLWTPPVSFRRNSPRQSFL